MTAKIIDLGLAKAVNEPGSQTAISTPGGFAGTPEFASPEQFAGRRRGHPLGSVLAWRDALGDGDRPERHSEGTPAEVMYQHQHAPLPLERLKDVPQPVVVLLEMLLEKDPAQRFQTPTELLKAIPTITDAIDAGRRITRQSLQKTPSAGFACRNSQAASKTGTGENFSSQIARYRKRCFWSRGGYRFSGSCMGKQGCQRRYNRCLGWCRKVHARQPLAPTDGC